MKRVEDLTIKRGVIFLLVLGLYILAGKWGLSFATVHKSASAIWPPTGVALASLLLFGEFVWPAVFIGAFIVNITTAGSIPVCLGIALGNTLEAWTGSYLVKRYAGGVNALHRPQNIFKFAVLAGCFSTTISPSIGLTSLAMGGYAPWDQYGHIWVTWWLGDAMGNFLVAPLLILWGQTPAFHLRRESIAEFILLFASLITVSIVIFSGLLPEQWRHAPLEFLCVPVLIWASFRFGRRISAAATIILASVAIWGTLHNYGPFSKELKSDPYILLQAFLAVVSLLAISVATVVWELKRIREGLEQARDELEIQVREGNVSLTQMVQALKTEVSERRRAAEALKVSEERIRSLVEGVRDYAIIMLDENGVIRSWNTGAEKINGYKAQDIIGRNYSCFFPPEDLARGTAGLLLELAKNQGKIETQGIRVRKDGTTFLADVVLTALHDDSGRLKGFSKVTRDITQRKQAEQALLQKERLLAHINGEREQLELFANMASHDLQEPLRKIVVFGDLLRQETSDQLSEEGKDYLDRMQNAARRMGLLVEDVLSFSKAMTQKTAFEWIDLGSVVKEVLEDLDLRVQECNAQFVVDPLPTIEINRNHVYELFQNILSNAIKYHKKDQAPIVTIKSRSLEEDRVEITIEDNGIGFDEKYAARIFKPFERLHRKDEFGGSGIGLAICKRIVSYHGGEIMARSVPDVGSTFIVLLPAHSLAQTQYTRSN